MMLMTMMMKTIRSCRFDDSRECGTRRHEEASNLLDSERPRRSRQDRLRVLFAAAEIDRRDEVADDADADAVHELMPKM